MISRIKLFFIKKTIDQLAAFAFLPKRTCEHLELKETKNITHFPLSKAHPHLWLFICWKTKLKKKFFLKKDLCFLQNIHHLQNMKKSFILKIFFTEKNIFTERNIYDNVSHSKNVFLYRKCFRYKQNINLS